MDEKLLKLDTAGIGDIDRIPMPNWKPLREEEAGRIPIICPIDRRNHPLVDWKAAQADRHPFKHFPRFPAIDEDLGRIGS